MANVFAYRSDWLVKVMCLSGFDVCTIHPLDGLTFRMVIEAMSAQKILYKKPGKPEFRILVHGNKILIQKERPCATAD